MLSKILIDGKIELITGMHIGTGGEFSAIGAVDSPVVRDPLTGDPIITGSTLKGKLRAMLAKKYDTPEQIRNEDDCDDIKRIFGSTKNPSRFIFSDMRPCNLDELKKFDIHIPTETKFENTINRFTGVANPRQIERVIRGTCFSMNIIYDVCANTDDDCNVIDDIKLLAEAMQLLHFDYLGGHGSRGYGKVAFKDLNAQLVVGDIDDTIIEEINSILGDVKPYEL